MSAVFLDTVGLLALWDESDQWHTAAEAAFEKLSRQKATLLTTAPILLECGNAAARHPYRSAVARLRRHLEDADSLVHPTLEDWDAAWPQYERGLAGDAGIVDHISFVVMRRLGIHEAFTNDGHFRAAGFFTLFLTEAARKDQLPASFPRIEFQVSVPLSRLDSGIQEPKV